MSVNTWIIAVDSRRIGGIIAAVKPVAGEITAAVVGTRALADEIAATGVDKVVWFETAEGVPAEALAASVAAAAKDAGVRLAVSNDGPSARVILGTVAGAVDAAVLGSVIEFASDGDALLAGKLIANEKAIETVKADGALAAIYFGADEDIAGGSAPVEAVAAEAGADRIVGFEEATVSGLSGARRVVGVGMGVGSRENLPVVEGLAEALGAEIACTLPCCNDMHWYTADRVLGSSHNTASPELYIALGISGNPNHTSGFRDAKTVVAINKNPDAEIFNVSKYGIVADLFDIVPVLTEALK
ncbi:MAG: electron transfer flavoprotein subunit alpha/FixB family protein [Coriobacteriales bacterium]|jgi:electron transfer flavoprotein alpha subunit